MAALEGQQPGPHVTVHIDNLSDLMPDLFAGDNENFECENV